MKLLTLFAVIAASAVCSAPARAKGKILFFDLESPAATRAVAKRINASLRSWVNSSDGLSSMYGESLAETRRLHCKSTQLKRSFHACLARIGVREKADRLVIGSVLPHGPNYRVVLTIVDTREPTKAVTITEQLLATSTQGTALEAWIRRLFLRMFKGTAGYLIMTCNLDGVLVTVDKQRAGPCGKGIRRLKLAPGLHRVSFRRKGYLTLVHRITIRTGETTRLTAKLKPAPRPVPRPRVVVPPPRAATTPVLTKSQRARQTMWRALFFSTLSAGVVLLVSSGFTVMKVRDLENQKDLHVRLLQEQGIYLNDSNVCNDGMASPELRDICNKGVRMSLMTNIFIGVGAGLVATSAIFLYFAYIKKRKRSTRTERAASSATITPLLWKGGGGVTATLKF